MTQSLFLLHAIRTLSNQLKKEHNFRMQNFEASDGYRLKKLTGHRYGIMEYIHRHHAEHEIYQKDIESAFHLERSTVSALLKSLEENGYITRTPSEHDGRLKKIMPTQQSEFCRNIAKQISAELNAQLTEGVSDEEIATFMSTAGKFLRNLERMDKQH